MVESQAPDVVILDLGLPDISGFEVLKQIRLFSRLPVIILTVMGDEANIVRGLEYGADDYVVKPFRQMEFLARVKAVIRRQSRPDEELPLVCGPLRLDPATHQVRLEEKEINLTATEAAVLGYLMQNPGRVATHTGLAEAVWGLDYPGSSDSLKVYIRRLREKLETDPGRPRIILTRTGVGYSLAKPD
jgi:two-component system KDP operon response regulator KdpE